MCATRGRIPKYVRTYLGTIPLSVFVRSDLCNNSIMKLIVGLGNPGTSYEDTRHNIGFMVVDKLVKEIGETSPVWEEDHKRNALVAKIGGVIIAKPMTFMNNSGSAVAALTAFYKINKEDVWVIHDDIDLPIGKIRIRKGGGTGGHNGVDSIMQSLKK